MSTSEDDRSTANRNVGKDATDGMVEEALKAAQAQMQLAAQLYRDELWQLRAEHAHLQSRYDHLKERHEALKETHSMQSEAWKSFKVWWMGKIDKKLANITQSTPARGGDKMTTASTSASSPLLTNTGVTPDTSRRRPKLKCTEEEKEILRNVGLDCYIESTPLAQELRQSKIEEEEKQQRPAELVGARHTSPMSSSSSSITPARDAIVASEGAQESKIQSSKRRKTLEDFDMVKRRKLVEIDNISDSRSPPPSTTILKQESQSESAPAGVLKGNGQEQVPEGELLKPRKGRGRYSAGPSRTINGEYEIDPKRNGNLPFLHKSVIRDKAERKQMHAHDCVCCSEYYQCVGDAPLRKYQDPRTVQRSAGEGVDTMQQQHRQQISRHRAYGPPASTPPHYWDVSFPSTQMQEQVNEMARQENQKKREQMACDPRFRKRAAADG